MSYENDKLMNLEDGQLLLSAVDKRKADIIAVTDTTPSPVKTLTDGADGLPMALTVGIEPVQAGSGDPSPSNVRAISGRSAVKISRTGKNLYDGTVEDGYIADDGTVGVDNANYHSDYIKVEPGDYTYSLISNVSSNTNRRVHGYDANKQWVAMLKKNISNLTGQKEYGFTVPSGVEYIRVQFYQKGSASNKDTNIQIERGSFTSYEAYSGHTDEITIPSTPGTVYGGSLTVNKDGTGKLSVSDILYTIDGTRVMDFGTGSGIENRVKTTVFFSQTSIKIGLIKNCNSYPIVTTSPTVGNIGVRFNTNGYIYIFNGSFTSLETAQSMLNETPVEVIIEKVTPDEYTLTAEQVNALITSLKGVNNIYADSGDVLSVDYSADTKLYVDEHNEAEDTAITSIKGMIAESDAPVATESHAIGEVFICSDQLLRATSVIASGETISTGTGGNAEVLNLSEYIAEVIASVSTARTAIVDGDTAVYNWLNPMMVLTKTNIGGDQEVTNSYRKVTRKGNHITFERTGNSTTSVHFNMTGAIEKYVDKDISQYITLPDLTGVRMFLVLKYNCHSYSGSAASPFSYHVRTWDKNAEHDVDVASISPDGTTVGSVIASNGICTIDIDSVLPNARANKNLNVSFFSRRSDMEAEFDLNIIAMPVTQTT